MTSTLNQDLKGETYPLSSRISNDAMLFDSASIIQNNNTFGMEHFQNLEGHLKGQQDTPTTPSQYFQNKNTNYNNYLQGMHLYANKDYIQSSYFSPIVDNQSIQLKSIFSPPDIVHSNNRDDQLILQNSHHQLTNPNFQFPDYENNDNNGTPFAPNGGNSGQNFLYSHFSRMNSFQNSQINTPLNPMSISPCIPILQSGGRHHAHNGSITTPHQLSNFQSSHNNLFNQSLLHQSPYICNNSNNKDYLAASYDVYNNIQPNDVFEDMSLKEWICPQNYSEVKEEDERSQSFMNGQNSQIHQKLKKKLKVEDKEQLQRINDENNDMNSCTQEDLSGQYNNGKAITSQPMYENPKLYVQPQLQNLNSKFQNANKYNRVLNSSEKTLKQHFYVPLENEKFSTNSATPVKVENTYSYMTPTIFSKSKIKEEEFSSHVDDQHHHHPHNFNHTHSHIGRLPAGNDQGADSDEEKGGKRNQRGLRILSMKVKDIVCELKETTYKQVAEFLIKDLESKRQNNNTIDKEEQNVKRRVYDALNVLIAANVLSKHGKKVKADHTLPKGKNSSQNPHQKKEYLQTALKLKRDRLERKQETINDLVSKYTSLKNLCERNAQNESKADEIYGLKQLLSSNGASSSSTKGVSTTQQLKCISLQKSTSATQEEGTEKKLRFPFIGVYSPSNNSRISFKKFNCGLVVSSIQQLNLKGDIDILVQLYKNQPQSVIRQDKLKFLDPELINFLNKMQNFLSVQSEQERQDETEQHLQMEITIRNNKHIEQHHYQSNGNSQNVVKNQLKYKEQQSDKQDSAQDEENSQETINQPNNKYKNRIQTNTSIYQTPQPQEYNQNHNDYEDSNQLINDYMN